MFRPTSQHCWPNSIVPYYLKYDYSVALGNLIWSSVKVHVTFKFAVLVSTKKELDLITFTLTFWKAVVSQYGLNQFLQAI